MLLMINAFSVYLHRYTFQFIQKKKKKKKKHDDDEIKEAIDESYEGYLSWPNI